MHTPKTYFRLHHDETDPRRSTTGVTNNLIRRVREHKTETGSGFAAKYKLDCLVYFERSEDIRNAVEREKRIKGWLHIKKIALVVSINPAWRDLSREWHEHHQFQPPTPLSP
jgi:putative endonuclease